MHPIKTLAMVVVSVMLTGCGTMKEMKIRNIAIEFDQSTARYNRMVRWHEFDTAEATYVPPKLRDEYRKRIMAAKEVNIVDFRVKSMECSPEKREGSVVAEIDYYRPPSVTVRTLEDRQLWSYEGDEEHRAWRLTTLLPEFK